MNWLDVVLLVLLVGWILLGLKGGIILGLVPLAGLLAGLYLSIRYSGPLGSWLSFLPQPTAAKWIAFGLILVLTLLLAAGVARLLHGLVESALLGWLDHTLGAFWGLFVGAVILAAVLTIWIRAFGDTEPIRVSPVAQFLLARFDSVLNVLPAEFNAVRDFFGDGLRTIAG